MRAQLKDSRHAFVKTKILHSIAPIRLILPHDSVDAHVYNIPVLVMWTADTTSAPFRVTIRNLFREIIDQSETVEMRTVIDLTQDRFVREKLFYITVASIAKPAVTSIDHIISRCSVRQQRLVSEALAEINVDGKTALDHLILAGFFEEHRLYTDAISEYTKSVARASGIQHYQEAFDLFLVRHGFKKE
jgi:hypothetical protein